VASNQNQPQSAEDWLEYLRKFSEESENREEIYKELIKLAIKKTYFSIEEILVEAKKVSDEMKEKGLVNSPE